MATDLRALRARLAELLFPDAPAGTAGGRAERALIAGGILLLAILLQPLRIGWGVAMDSLWAEDGQYFLQDAVTDGPGTTLLDSYAGYLVFVPRLIGELAALAPLADAPVAVSILSAAAIALSGFAVWQASAAHIRDPWLRGTLATLTVLCPVASLEAVDSAAYVPWYMLFATFWLLLWRPPTRTASALSSLFVLATALSTAGVWFFAPVAAARALCLRGARDVAVTVSFWLGAAIQVPVVLSQEPLVDPAWSNGAFPAYAQRVVDAGLLGQELGGEAWVRLGIPFLAVLCLLAAAGFAFGLARAGSRARWLAAIALATSVGFFFASAYQRAVGSDMAWREGFFHGSAGRYAIVPALLLAAAALVLIDDLLRREGAWRPSAARLAVVGVAAIAVATSFSLADRGYRGDPPWEATLRTSATDCRATGNPEAYIPASPPGFAVRLECSQVSEYAAEP